MPANSDRFEFGALATGAGRSGYGPGVDLRPQLPASTDKLFGVDLTHRIDVADVAQAAAGGFDSAAAKGGGGGGGHGGGGGGGSTSFAPYTTSGSAYNITIEFKGSWTEDLYLVFKNAADRLSQIIVGDVPDVSVIMKGGIKLVDDILIIAELKTIDGSGGILGQAGPTSLRTGSYLPATASMQFDVADAANFAGQNLFDEIVTHEMLHSVGFGTIWSYTGVASGFNYTGANALAEYNALLIADGQAGGATFVPLENGGGSGTAGSHWSEAVFDHELMTGYIDLAPDPLSRMTAASLADIGYQVDMGGPIDGFMLA